MYVIIFFFLHQNIDQKYKELQSRKSFDNFVLQYLKFTKFSAEKLVYNVNMYINMICYV